MSSLPNISRKLVWFVCLFACGFAVSASHVYASGTATADVPNWGNPLSDGPCIYGNHLPTNCWVYNHPADQGVTACLVKDVSYNPGEVGPGKYSRQDATGIANIADQEGYQWAGGCYDNDNHDPTPNQHPCDPNNGEDGDCKQSLGEGPDCSGLVWRVWRESNYSNPSDNSFFFWPRSLFDHGPYLTGDFKNPAAGAPNISFAQLGKPKTALEMMDAEVSSGHIGIYQFRLDSGDEWYWEAWGEKPGTDEFPEQYAELKAYSPTRRKAWG